MFINTTYTWSILTYITSHNMTLYDITLLVWGLSYKKNNKIYNCILNTLLVVKTERTFIQEFNRTVHYFRFSEQNRQDSHQYSFLPFGQGPRMCPGQKLAIIKVKIAVINILRNFTLTTCKRTEVSAFR